MIHSSAGLSPIDGNFALEFFAVFALFLFFLSFPSIAFLVPLTLRNVRGARSIASGEALTRCSPQA